MKNKVKIVISDKDFEGNYREFDKSVPGKGGKRFIDVSCNANTYGSHSPCSSSEEIKSAVTYCKEWIIREGDIPIVEDIREKNTLAAWS